jgi:acetyltransferase-like isoleucine patch superfamily enzyme
MDDVAIYGAAGFGGEVQDILQQGGRYRPVMFLDSDPATHRTVVGGLPVRGGLEQVDALWRAGLRRIVVAIGDNVTPSARFGQHVIIGARATICVHAHVGPHAVLSPGAIAEHDNVIGVAAFIGPAVRLAGTVTVDDFATLEIGATVIPGRRIGCGARVKAGAVVIRDVPPRMIVAGVPADVDGVRRPRFVAETCGVP